MKYLRFYIKEISKYGWTYALVLSCQLLMVALSLAYVWLSKKIVDAAVDSFKGIETGNNELVIYAVVFLALALLRPSITSLKSYFQSKMTVNMSNAMRLRLFDAMLHIKSVDSRKYHSGDIINRIQGDVSAISSTFCSSVPELFWAFVQFVAAFAYMLSLDKGLAWILVVIIPIAVFGGKFIMLRLRKLTLEIRESDSMVQSHIQESVQHLSLIQSLEYGGTSSDSLDGLLSDNFSKNMRRTRFSIFAKLLVAFSFTLAYAVAFLWGAFGIAEGIVSYGAMTAILQLVGQVQRPFVYASDRLPSLFHCTASIDRIEEIQALHHENYEQKHFLEGTAGVRIENLHFRYPDSDSEVISDLSFVFEPGSRTAIVGPTGIGKSTLIRLMLSFLSPTSGKIRLYSASEEVEASESTRCNLIYVPQGNSLFSGTVRENLLMGDPEASEDALREALHTAAADFVLDLPAGLDTPCFEQGGGLSEGQAQRIAIARAILRQGSILLLDEFSSALDSDTEELLLKRLTAAKGGRTMIFITHREKVVDYCDSVLRL